MNIFTVSFFGHRRMDAPFTVEQSLERMVRELLLKEDYVEFLVGRDGVFDQLVSSTVLRCKHAIRSDHSSLIWVMPYLTAEYQTNRKAFHAYYDEIEVCECSAQGYFKAAFQKRNRAMVDRSNLVIFYVERSSGGAYQTMRYAEKKGKQLINLVCEHQ